MSALPTMPETPSAHAWPEALRDQAESMSGLGNDELRHALVEALAFSAQALTKAAVVIRLLEERGEEIDGLINSSLGRFLRFIAYGQLLPEVVERYFVQRELCKRIARMPIPEQRKLVDDSPVAVVEEQDGEVTHRMVRPSILTPRQQMQVFAPDHVRDIGEQRSWIQDRQASRPRLEQQSPIVIDGRRGGIVVTGSRILITTKELAEYLARLSK